jgi:predicted acylesterase/phospholipase RssA
MRRIGLALSGGGFRATLYHLGMIRFLREANILPNVTHITSVSGGSILAAHLALHWDRYNGSLEEFDAAAAELIRFVQLDIRNRVVRRYPLALPLRMLRRLTLQRPNRRLTRPGLLEYHYEKFLYGDTCLFQLPERPRLSILATNLSEGCLCAFTRDGLVMQRRRPAQRFQFDRIHTGLATVPMAVTASSAFPGFFPPLELQGQDVGADPGRFGRMAFTDGGVYDNLGVRMFRWMERSWLAGEVPLEKDDLIDAEMATHALHAAANSADDTPLRRLSQMMALLRKGTPKAAAVTQHEPVDQLLGGLWDVMNHENLAREPSFASLSLSDPDAAQLLSAAQGNDGEIEAGEQLWLNRQLVDAAFQRATSQNCFCSPNPCFDTVLVSDAGKQFKIRNAPAGGLIATAMRATDIVMDRVWQLETDTFTGTPGFVFAPISRVIEPDDDPTASHPEVQRMTANIRTDLDRFSPLEISSLVRHGYCVGRSACQSRGDLFGTSIPDGAPWDPLAEKSDKTTPPVPLISRTNNHPAAPETKQSRELQKSGARRIWSRLLDYRDWTSFLYVPLLIPLLVVLPYFAVKWYRQSQVAQQLIEGIAQSNQDYALMSKLLQEGPMAPFAGEAVEDVKELAPIDNKGIEVIADMRVLDMRQQRLRAAQATDEQSLAFVYRRMRIRKTDPAADRFVVHFRLPTAQVEVRELNHRIPSVIRKGQAATAAGGAPAHILEIAFDLSKVPERDVIDLPIELMSRNLVPRSDTSANFYVDDETGILSYWLLLPEGVQYQNFELLRYLTGKGSAPERVAPAYLFNTLQGQVLAFALLNLKPGFVYECRWDNFQ